MKRQLRMNGGIMDIVPRERAILGGIKKAVKKTVKKVTGGIKDIISSDLGKAALLAAGAYYAPGFGIKAQFGPGIKGLQAAGVAARSKLGDFFIGSPLTEGTGRDTFATSGLGKLLGIGGASAGANTGTKTGGGLLTKGLALAGLSTFLTSQYGLSEEEQEEELKDPEKLKSYLRVYYTNLNPNAGSEEIEEFVRVNSAKGGRIGFDEGSEDPAYMQDFSFSGQEKAEEFLKLLEDAKRDAEEERRKNLEEMYRKFILRTTPMEVAEGGRIGYAEGPVLPPDPTQPVNPFGPKPGDFGIEEDIPIKMASNIENDKILEALFEKYLDMGFSPKEAADKAREEFDRMSMMKTEGRGLAAIGGRMGFDEGTRMGLTGLGSLMDEEIVVIITQDEDGNPKLIQVPKSEVMKEMEMPVVVRDNKAKGDTPSDNAMQAAGVEGLPIRQNPKGVKELDLRKTGGFIPPVGIKEKADDIPAMLSNNEFVFTADAVRGAGGGNVNLGAQRMYDTMKRLEAGGKA